MSTNREAPKGYWGAADPGSWRSVIVMDDIAATKGARFSRLVNAITTSTRWERWASHDLADDGPHRMDAAGLHLPVDGA